MKSTIIRFGGPWAFLSNFYPCQVEMDGLKYPTLEHAYQAAKTLDKTEREKIFLAASPGEAKRLGRRAALREGWDKIRVGVMAELLRRKFARPGLKEGLLLTEGMLIEGNHWHDNFWGVCYCRSCPGTGGNFLGRLLMKTRRELREAE